MEKDKEVKVNKNTRNPEALSKINAVGITQDIKEFVTNLHSNVQEEKNGRAQWEQRIDYFRNIRYGIRNKKDFPWPGAANYVLPLIDSEINRIKPSYLNLINVYPMVSFEPFGAEDIEPARKREALRDWQLRTKMDFTLNYALGVDYALEQGAVVWKITWKFSTRTFTEVIDLNELDQRILEAIYDVRVTDELLIEILKESFMVNVNFEENVNALQKVVDGFRRGETVFELELVEEVENHPVMTPCSLRDDIVIPIGTTDMNEARFIDYLFPSSKNAIKIDMQNEKYNVYSDDVIESWVGDSDMTNRKKNRKMSYQQSYDDKTIWLHETCCWFDINGDGIEERCIVTYPDNDPDNVLRFIEMPYNHGQWPYVLVKREINDPGVYSSRGYCALLEDFQNGISTAFNQSVDNGTITNTPKVVYKSNSLANPRNIRYIPGEAVEMRTQVTDYQIMQPGNNSQGFLFQEAQYLKSWADQRTGSFTSGLSQINNVTGQGQGGNKTKREVDVIESMQSEIQSMDLVIWQQQMAKVYYQIDALYDQFEDAEEYQLVTNEQLVRMSRQEIQGKFNIVPTGRLDNSNPQMRLQKSMTLMRTFFGDPDIRQMELKKLFLQDYDVKLIKQLFKTPEEKQQEQAQALQMQDAMQKKMANDQLEFKSLIDSMDLRKGAVEATIQGRKYAPD